MFVCPMVARRIRAAGAGLWYLPPYSPDLNPIEKIWAKVKAYLRKAAARTTEALWEAIGQALQSNDLAGAQQAFAALQSAAEALGGKSSDNASGGKASGGGAGGGSGASGGSSSSSSKTIVSETQTTSSSGTITTVTTYSDGSKETTTSYGPTPASSQSVVA